MYYLQSRYYDPEIGRFISMDDTKILMLTQGEVLGANLFAYCNNNPVMYSDPSGYSPAQVAGVIIGSIIGLVGGYFLGNWLADLWGIKGWITRPLFVGGVSLLVGAATATIGFFIGPYIAEAGTVFFEKIKDYCAQLLEKGRMLATKLPISAQNFIKLTNHFAKKAIPAVKNYVIKPYHLFNGGGGQSKFITDNLNTIRGWMTTALQKGTNFTINSNDSYSIVYNMGQVIGTKGERYIKIVFSVAGKIITCYPQK